MMHKTSLNEHIRTRIDKNLCWMVIHGFSARPRKTKPVEIASAENASSMKSRNSGKLNLEASKRCRHERVNSDGLKD